MSPDAVVFKGEVQLAGWSESHSGGAKVTFFLSSPEELNAFRDLTVAKGKQAGHRMMMVCVEIGDDEKPVSQADKRGGSITKLAAMFCQQERFWQWARLSRPIDWSRAEALTMSSSPVEVSAEWVRLACGVASRSDLDHNPAAAKLFHEQVRKPYAAYLEDQAAAAAL
jgi:hypothetical protein